MEAIGVSLSKGGRKVAFGSIDLIYGFRHLRGDGGTFDFIIGTGNHEGAFFAFFALSGLCFSLIINETGRISLPIEVPIRISFL